MQNKQLFGILLIAVGFIFFYIGYQKSQPTVIESLAGGITEITKEMSALSGTGSKYAQNLSGALDRSRTNRGLPFYLFGGLSVISGLVLLLKS